MLIKTKLLFIVIALLFINGKSFSQLGNNNMTLLSHLNQHPTTSSDVMYSACWGYVAPNGREYAVLGCYTGTSFVDITDSSNIHEVGFVKSLDTVSFWNEWREMKTYSHYAYIVSELPNSGIQIVDLQYLPDSVHFVKKFVPTGHTSTHSIQQEGPYLYLNGCNSSFSSGGIAVLDLSVNPETPILRGKWTTKYVHDCRVVDSRIFACNIYNSDGGTITVIDAWNKDNLQTISSWVNNPSPGPHNCALTPDRKYCLATDEINGTPRLLKIWNIQDITNVTQVATWQPTGITNTIVHNVEVYGNYAVIAHYEAGIRVVNISNPAAPTEVAWYDTDPAENAFDYRGCWGVYMFPSGKIIGSDMQTGLYVVKPTTPLTGLAGGSNLIPDMYSLSQNYPNPFNPSTKINFSLPKSSQVSLKIINLAGQVVADLVNDRRDAGNYEVTFDAAKYGLSSGAYFYQLKTGDFTETKKMLLVK